MLDDTCYFQSEGLEWWSRWSDLNRQPTPYEGVALPLSYIGARRLAGGRSDCSSTELLRPILILAILSFRAKKGSSDGTCGGAKGGFKNRGFSSFRVDD